MKEVIVFKSWNNFFKFKDGKFFSYGKAPNNPYSIGSWFNCGEEETNRLRKAILSGDFKLQRRIPGLSRVYE